MSNPPDLGNPAQALPTRLTCEGVGYEVWIAVEGKEAPIYAREYDESKKEVTCWIESEAGKRFFIMYKPTIDEYAMGMKVLLDGCLSEEFILVPGRQNIERQISCVRTSQSAGQQLTFGLLELTDDDAYLNQSLGSESFGEIRIVVDKKSSFTQTNLESDRIFKLAGTEKVHERSKKGLTHQIKAGPTEEMPKRGFVCDSTSAGLLATFIFRYRTRAMLQANGIIAPDPTPSASQDFSQPANDAPPVKREPSEEQSDDDDGMGEREKALLAELEEIRQKKRAKDSGGNSRKKIKTESDTPKFYFKPGEVIDLTDDAPRAKVQPKRKGREMKKEILDLTL